MFLSKLDEVRNPIIFIALCIIVSSICYGLYSNYIWPAFIIAGCFFAIIYFSTNMYFLLVIIIFYIIGVGININYYSCNFNENFNSKVRVVEEKSYYKIVKCNGKRIYVFDDINMNIGDSGILKGKFTKEINYYKGTIGTLDVIKETNLNPNILGKLYEFRDKIYLKLKDNLGKRRAGLIVSLSFGYSNYLDEEDSNDMRALGIVHAISVSGLHVVLIYSTLKRLLKEKIALLGVVLYVIFTGAPFSSIRALIMIACLSMSFSFRKKYNALGGLSLSAIIITLISPYAPFQIGFQLSFLATLGIILFAEKFDKKLYKLPKFLREPLSMSISAQILTLPIIILAFNEVSITFLIGNVILVPILTLLIKLGNALLLCFFIPPIFDFISFIILNIIDILDYFIDYFYYLPLNVFVTNEWFALIYVCFIIGIYLSMKVNKKFILLPIVANIIFMIFLYSPIPRVDYYKDGAILISYKGERVLVSNIRNIDMYKLKRLTLATQGYREGKVITLNNNIKFKLKDKNFTFNLDNKHYIINMNGLKNIERGYDIIDFNSGDITGFYILDSKILLY